MEQPLSICPHCHKPIETHVQFSKPLSTPTGVASHVVRFASGAHTEAEPVPIVLTVRTPKYEWTANYTILPILVGMIICLVAVISQLVSCFLLDTCISITHALLVDSVAFLVPTVAMWRFLDNSRYEVKEKVANLPKVKKDTFHHVRVSEQTSHVSSRHVSFTLPKPITPTDIQRVAIAMQGEGATFSRYYLSGKRNAISERNFHKLSHVLRDRGLAEKVATNRVELTRGGKAFFRSYLPPKTNSDDIVTTKI